MRIWGLSMRSPWWSPMRSFEGKWMLRLREYGKESESLKYNYVCCSQFITKLTGTFSKVAAYEFTTLTCVPGVIRYKGAKIQLLDLPGIIEGAKDGKGRGKQVIAAARTCNLIVIVHCNISNTFSLLIFDVGQFLSTRHAAVFNFP